MIVEKEREKEKIHNVIVLSNKIQHGIHIVYTFLILLNALIKNELEGCAMYSTKPLMMPRSIRELERVNETYPLTCFCINI